MSSIIKSATGIITGVEARNIKISKDYNNLKWSKDYKHVDIILLNRKSTAKLEKIDSGIKAIIANTEYQIGVDKYVWLFQIHTATTIRVGMATKDRDLSSDVDNNDHVYIELYTNKNTTIKFILGIDKLNIIYDDINNVIDITPYAGQYMRPWVSDIVEKPAFSITISGFMETNMYYDDNGSMIINTTSGTGIASPIIFKTGDAGIYFDGSPLLINRIIAAPPNNVVILEGTNSLGITVEDTTGDVTLDGSLLTTNSIDITGNITITGTVDGVDISTDVAANTLKISAGGTIGTHSDVDITGVTDLDVFQYDNGTSKWVNKTLGDAGISSTGHIHISSEITDFNATTESIITAHKGVINGLATLDGLGKVPLSQLSLSNVIYCGTWDALNNIPELFSGGGVVPQGCYYVVSVAGSTDLDGENLWRIGDWAIFNGTVWEKVDNAPAPDITDLESKTQNISLVDTTITQTLMTQDLKLGGSISIANAYEGNTNGTGFIATNGNYGFRFTPTVDITITNLKYSNLLLIPALERIMAVWRNSDGANLGQHSFNGTEPVVAGYYNSPVNINLLSGQIYVISVQHLTSNLPPLEVDTNINKVYSPLLSNIVSRIISPTNDLIMPSNDNANNAPYVPQFEFVSSSPQKSIYAQTAFVESVVVNNDWAFNSTATKLTLTNSGYETVVGVTKPIETEGTTLSHINYDIMKPINMLSPLTAASGGVNRCWGHTATYIAETDLLAGRVVALSDQTTGTDNTNALKIGYLRAGTAIVPTIYPMGITQHNCLAGQSMLICIGGYTTVICLNALGSPERGSIVLGAATVDFGKVRIGIAAAAIESRIGFCAQSDSFVANSPCLIKFTAYFQAT
jgi:hypothetical protein